jgi:hypothetical protein
MNAITAIWQRKGHDVINKFLKQNFKTTEQA